MFEEYFRRQLLLSHGDFTGFVDRPISGTLFAIIGMFITWQLIAFFVKTLRKVPAPTSGGIAAVVKE
jgi:TctA family transporter